MPDTGLSSVRLADTELHYQEKGSGPTVVLVHGGLGDYRQWGPLSSFLSQDFRVISYSRRSYFPNRPSTSRPSAVTHSEDLSSLISQLSDRPVHLVGESIGAYVALHCAIHHPEKVRSQAIDEPPALSLLRENEEDRGDLEDFMNKALRPSISLFAQKRPEDAARIIIDYLEGSPGVYDSLPDGVKMVIAANCPATFDDLEGGFDGIKQDEPRLVKVPSLLMKSELGPNVLKRVVDRLSGSMPNSELVEIKGTTHGTIYESPEYFKTVSEFIKQSEGR